MDEPWPFDQPPNGVTLTVRSILEGKAPILWVSHDAEDYGWQFLDGGPADMSRAAVVALQAIVELDPTVLEVSDLPPGWTATRETAESDWTRWPPDKR
ncbi:MAG: hypothetical protein AAF750_05905 [Planctomycetota bacterium]